MKNDYNNLEKYKTKVFFQEFMIDILGGLVPGILFISGCFISLMMPIYILFITYSSSTVKFEYGDTIALLESLSGTPGTLWFFIFIGIFLLTYVV
ncbi:hypothetical protein ACFL50_06955, partial [Candidatus Latescibacterota bacterium]